MMSQAIVVEGLGKRFRAHGKARGSTSLKEAFLTRSRGARGEDFWGLRDVNFSIPTGRTVGIVGKNGAGKSTLLRLVSRVIHPDEGKVTVRGRIGALLDLGAGLTDDLTGRENIFLSGVISGMTRAEVRARFDEIVAFAELEDVLDDPIRVYSSGMRMRLAFAVASHISPDVLLIDEVLAVGDSAFQRKCLDRLANFKASGCTILVVSHDGAQIRAVCDEVILLRGGRMQAYGSPHDVMEQYDALVGGRTVSPGAEEVPDAELAGGRRLQIGVNRFGTQETQIEAVRLLNARGYLTGSILSGDSLTVEIDYQAKLPVAFPKASISLEAPNGTCCLDTNTDVGGLELQKLFGRGTLRVRLERLDLREGHYFLSVGLFSQDWDLCLDFHQSSYTLEVIGSSSGKGVLNPPCRWELARVGSVAELERGSSCG